MLKVYIVSVVIWMIMIFCTGKLLTPYILKNGWCDNMKTKGKKRKPFTLTFLLAAVPIFRVLIWATFFVMAVFTEEQWNTLINGTTQKDKSSDE